jgi:hypothetical protein
VIRGDDLLILSAGGSPHFERCRSRHSGRLSRLLRASRHLPTGRPWLWCYRPRQLRSDHGDICAGWTNLRSRWTFRDSLTVQAIYEGVSGFRPNTPTVLRIGRPSSELRDRSILPWR